MPKKLGPYYVGWAPDWLEEWQDKSLTWPGWEYEKKAAAVSDAKSAAKNSRVPVVVYDRFLNIVERVNPSHKDTCPPAPDKILVERLRREMSDAQK